MATPSLVEVGTAIADGTPLDWSASALSSEDPALRSVLAELQLIERIALVHASPGDRSLWADYDSLLNPRSGGPLTADAPVTWGPLTIVEKIGRGAFGEVYRARDPRLDRPVALKLMRRRERDAAALETEVIEEGRLLARVNHPNVVAVHGAERIDGRVGLWMAFVEGRTLADEVSTRGPLPAREVIEIGVALASALGAVHDAGLLHRDIKTQNVMRDAGGRVLLTDFGAGRELFVSADGHADGPAGTPLYLAPEVLEGAPASRASDVYSLGVLLYFLVSGSFPVPGRSVRDLRDAHARGARTSLRAVRPDTPAGLAAIIERAIAADPARRYQSAAELGQALERAVQSPWRRPQVIVPAIAAAVMGVVALFAVWRPAVPGAPIFAEPGALTSVPIWREWDRVLLGNPSPDGRWLPCTVQSGPQVGRLARCDLQSGAVDLIGDDALRARPYPGLNRDGRSIAYITLTPVGTPGALHVVNADGTNDRLLLAEASGEVITLHDWAPDGTEVLAVRRPRGAGGQSQLVAISISTGAVRAVTTAGTPVGQLSPDGRHMLFARRDSDGRFDLWTRDLSAGTEVRIADDVWDYGPRATWTPSGAVVFTSDRAGTLGLWRVEVRDGAPIGGPILIKDTGRHETWPYGFTADGTFVHGLEPVGFDSYVATVDAGAARVDESPRRLAAHPLDANATPAWSPDGEWIAYVSMRPGDPAAREANLAGVVTLRRVGGGDERQFPIQQQYHQTRLRWWPDGRSVLLLSGERRDRETGEVVERLFGGLEVRAFEIDPNGGLLYYLVRGMSPNHELRVLDLDTRADRLVVSGRFVSESGFSLSPDGRTLAVVARSRTGIEVRIVATGTGAATSLPIPDQPIVGPFTPDGRHLFLSRDVDSDSTSQVFVLDLSTGSLRPLDIVMPQIWQMQLHPDGRRLAFVQGRAGQELFAMKGDLVR